MIFLCFSWIFISFCPCPLDFGQLPSTFIDSIKFPRNCINGSLLKLFKWVSASTWQRWLPRSRHPNSKLPLQTPQSCKHSLKKQNANPSNNNPPTVQWHTRVHVFPSLAHSGFFRLWFDLSTLMHSGLCFCLSKLVQGYYFSNIGAFGFKLLYSMMLYSGLCFDLSH